MSPPCLIQPPPLKYMLLVGAVMVGSGVWQDCQSLPTCTLHQQVDPHVGKETTTAITPCGLSILSTTPFSPLSVHPHVRAGIVHPHAGTIVLFILTHRILPSFYSRSELGAMFFHPRFPCEGPFTFFCHVYAFLTDLWLVYMFIPSPAENLAFLFHLRTM